MHSYSYNEYNLISIIYNLHQVIFKLWNNYFLNSKLIIPFGFDSSQYQRITYDYQYDCDYHYEYNYTV